MKETHKRALLYGSAVLVLGSLGFAMAVADDSADAMTLLSSADVQLRLAHGIPATDRQGRALEAREQMIATAEQQLAGVERLQPGMAVTAEFQGFACMLRGRYVDAAAMYEKAQQCADCQPEQRDILIFNQARMLGRGGQRQQALDVFARHGKALDQRFGHQRSLEEATLLRELGKRTEAEKRLDAVVRDATAPPLAWLHAGVEFLELGHFTKAEATLQRIAATVPIADYHLACLKLRLGDADTCLALLERAAAAQPAEVRRRLQDEAAAWSAVSANARFQQLLSPRTATPGR